MINANDIRINNWLHHNESWCYRERKNPFLKGFDFQFDEQDWYAIGECTMSLDNVSGIPLTEDWLLRFGFENITLTRGILYPTFEKKYRHVLVESSIKLQEIDTNMWMWLVGNTNVHIYEVHQLQNLYFALTGQELELKKYKYGNSRQNLDSKQVCSKRLPL